jgi:hypothetical protein
MKNLLAILAIAILGTASAFAVLSTTNTLTVDVTCPEPTVTTTTGFTPAGYDFVAGTTNDQTATVIWKIAGRGTGAGTTVGVALTTNGCNVTGVTVGAGVFTVTGADVTGSGPGALASPYIYTTTDCDAEFAVKMECNIHVDANASAGSYSNIYTITISD